MARKSSLRKLGSAPASATTAAPSRKHRLDRYLYLLQLCQYDSRAYRRLISKVTTGQVTWTPRVRRVKRLTIFLCLLGLGGPALCLARTVAVANWLLRPHEHRVNQRFLRQAQRKLQQQPHLIKIGITGSYGKTSVKNILQQMLATRYRVLASPASFNTPLGFARTINELLTPDTEILIMEMGARRPGDVQEMCALVSPDHGIITSIGACHLETFGDIAAVARTKAELFANIPATGWAITDGDAPECAILQHPNLQRVCFAGNPVYDTPLLGKHNQKNILLAAALARHLGLNEAQIKAAVATLKPTPHRLEKIVAPNGIIILDDSYNANPDSAAQALAVLDHLAQTSRSSVTVPVPESTVTRPGPRKVVQTPGFVEQGTHAAAAHAAFCEQLATVADAVIVVGAVNRAYFATGLAAFTASGGAVYYVADREQAKTLYPQLLQSGDILLLENDLPEQY